MRVGGTKSFLLATVVIIVTALAPRSFAAPIFYADSPVVPPGVAFRNISESSLTDPGPLFGQPSFFTTGIDFNPMAFGSFSSSSSGGGGDVTDGQLNFTVHGAVTNSGMVGIEQLVLLEGGDYSLLGTGTPSTQVLAGASIRATVTEVDGVAVTPILLTPVNASVGFNLTANPGVLQPWALGALLDIEAQLTGQNIPHTVGATRVEVTINNQMAALSEPSSVAFIAKKDFTLGVATELQGVIPEPATISMLGLATAGALMRRRR